MRSIASPASGSVVKSSPRRLATSTGADVYALSTTAGRHDERANSFAGTHRITLPQRGELSPTLELFAELPHRIQTCYDDATDTAIYLWGHAAHPRLRGSALLSWCADLSTRANPTDLRDLLGHFVVCIDDRRQRRITFISDALGLRPWFVGAHRGRLIAGSNVLGICSAGFSNGKVDYDAVSCWLKYNHTLGNASVVDDYKSVRPGSVTTYDATGRVIRESLYGQFEYTDAFLSPDEFADHLHDVLTRSFATLTRDVTEANFPLSGGFDSRLLFALATRAGLNMHAQTMETREYEVAIAREVAAALGHPLQIVPGKRRILDLFDDPFAFNAAGFPTGRNLVSALARRHPEMPLISGFMGDGVMRGGLTAKGAEWWAQDRQNLGADELTHKVHHEYTMLLNRFHLLEGNVARKIDTRAMQSLHQVIRQGQAAGKPLLYTDLHNRHRNYFSNIFLQHMHAADAIVPYHSWELINCRTRFDQRCYTSQNFREIFRRYFPKLAGILHTSEFIPSATNKRARPRTPASRHLRRFSADVAATLLLTDCLSGMRKKRIFSLLPSGLLGEPRFQEEIQFAYKLQLFERQLRRAGVRLDWGAI